MQFFVYIVFLFFFFCITFYIIYFSLVISHNKASSSTTGLDCSTQSRTESKNVILKRGRTILMKNKGGIKKINDKNDNIPAGNFQRSESIDNVTCLPASSKRTKSILSIKKSSHYDNRNLSLSGIEGIQTSDQNAYHINVSNSKFFVPRDYVFSNIGRSLDDLRFQVDPEMTKILRQSIENKSQSTNNIDICALNNNVKLSEVKSIDSDSIKLNTLKLEAVKTDNPTVVAKPIVIDECGVVQDYLIEAPLSNPNPQLIMEPKIYIPRLSIDTTDQPSFAKVTGIDKPLDNKVMTKNKIQRPIPSPRKLVCVDCNIRAPNKINEKPQLTARPCSNLTVVEPTIKTLSSNTPRTLISGRTSSLREKFESILEDVELRPGHVQLAARKSDRKPSNN